MDTMFRRIRREFIIDYVVEAYREYTYEDSDCAFTWENAMSMGQIIIAKARKNPQTGAITYLNAPEIRITTGDLNLLNRIYYNVVYRKTFTYQQLYDILGEEHNDK